MLSVYGIFLKFKIIVISGLKKLFVSCNPTLTSFYYIRSLPLQASTLTQNETGPVGPVTPSIYWSCKMFTGPTFFL